VKEHSFLYWRLHRAVMLVAHRFHWCYMEPMPIIEKDWQQVWCKWCGARYTRYIGEAPLTMESVGRKP
jgi:hypothetical protein